MSNIEQRCCVGKMKNRAVQLPIFACFEKFPMKMLLYAGVVLVVLGIASLVVPIPSSEKQGIKIGDTNIGVQTSHSEKVSPIVSAVLIAGGLALSFAGARSKS